MEPLLVSPVVDQNEVLEAFPHMEEGRHNNNAGNNHSVATQSVDHNTSSSSKWYVCGEEFPKAQVVFTCQIILIYIVTMVSLINLTLPLYINTSRASSSSTQLWTAMLCSCLGYILPHPKIHQSSSKKNLVKKTT